MYNHFEEVFEVLPKEIFPSDLGGTAKLTCQDISGEFFFLLALILKLCNFYC